jgi:hypothetical protein
MVERYKWVIHDAFGSLGSARFRRSASNSDQNSCSFYYLVGAGE